MRSLLIIGVLLQCVFGAKAIDTLRLSIDSVAMSKLSLMREGALASGLILAKHKKKVPAVFSAGSSEIEANIRLKGDWLDHVDTDKWSFRIELKNGHYKGMQRFSLQHPRTRGYLTEYEIHKLLERHGVMTTRYEFVVVIINGENKGIYAVEEHFDFPMLDRLDYREAPILKFNESVFWGFQKIHLAGREQINVEYPVFENASISSFRKKKIRQSEVLADQYVLGRDLVHALRTDNYDNLSDLVDVQSFATLYAICDAVGLYHGLIWHNLRFYVDPILKKLKPIAFDMWESKSSLNRPLMGIQLERTDTIYFSDIFFRDKFLNDDAFRSVYFEMLEELSELSMNNQEKDDSMDELLQIQRLLKTEFPTVDFGGIRFNQSLKMDLDSVENAFRPFEYYAYREWKKNNPEKVKVYAQPLPEQPIKGLGLKVFRESTADGKQRLTIINKHIEVLEVVGFSSKTKTLDHLIQVSPIVEDTSACLTLNIDTGFTKVAFRVPGDSIIHQVKISRYPYYHSIINPRSNSGEFEERNNEIHLVGDVMVDEIILVGEDQHLLLAAGTKITFGAEGGIYCLGSFASNGSALQPVVINSDSTFKGVMLAGPETKFTSTVFQGLQLSEDQLLTGVVTVSDSKLEMKDCQFLDINSEDALNGMRVEANLLNVVFSNCSSDALDLDFSSFQIDSISVSNSGNDGLDLSGSKGALKNSSFQNCGDKAISCGEQSDVILDSVNIENAQTGIATKDGSVVKMNQLSISKCEIGVWAFRKKPHYDGAQAILHAIQFENVNTQTQVDGFSTIYD